MRALRVAAAPVQLALPGPEMTDPLQRWWELPEQTRTQVLALLARLITRAVLTDQTDVAVQAGDD